MIFLEDNVHEMNFMKVSTQLLEIKYRILTFKNFAEKYKLSFFCSLVLLFAALCTMLPTAASCPNLTFHDLHFYRKKWQRKLRKTSRCVLLHFVESWLCNGTVYKVLCTVLPALDSSKLNNMGKRVCNIIMLSFFHPFFLQVTYINCIHFNHSQAISRVSDFDRTTLYFLALSLFYLKNIHQVLCEIGG